MWESMFLVKNHKANDKKRGNSSLIRRGLDSIYDLIPFFLVCTAIARLWIRKRLPLTLPKLRNGDENHRSKRIWKKRREMMLNLSPYSPGSVAIEKLRKTSWTGFSEPARPTAVIGYATTWMYSLGWQTDRIMHYYGYMANQGQVSWFGKNLRHTLLTYIGSR